jgi:hypothetical protein
MTRPAPSTLPDTDDILTILSARFAVNPDRHRGISWDAVYTRLTAAPRAVASLREMERTGGEPDVIGYDAGSDEFLFCDCSAESPAGRRSLCYDEHARTSRKANAPTGSAAGVAESIGATLLTEEEYIQLQRVGEFDTRTSSWLRTPADLRGRGSGVTQLVFS